MEPISEFWSWFIGFEKRIRRADQPIQDEILDLVLEKLHKIDDGLYFEIGTDPRTDELELVITPEGDSSRLELTKRIVELAPKIDSWKFVAFKQPMGFDFTTVYDGIELNPHDMWFLPLESAKNPTAIGLRIGFEDFDPESESKYVNASYIAIDTCIGEEVAMKYISYMDVCSLPPDPESSGFIKFTELDDYISWKKQQVI